jgi:hypothetical protein
MHPPGNEAPVAGPGLFPFARRISSKCRETIGGNLNTSERVWGTEILQITEPCAWECIQ